MIDIKDFIKSRTNLSPTKKKIAKNIYWATLGKVVGMLAQLFVGILVARYLGPEQYGLMNYVISYVAIFEVISEFGLSNIEIRELSSKKNDRNKILGSAFIVRILFTILAYILLAISLVIYKADTFTTTMILAYGLYIFTKCFIVIRNYFTSIILNEYVVKTEIFRTFLGALIKVILLLMHAPLAWFILAVAFDGFIVASGYIFNYHQKVGKLRTWTFDKKEAVYLAKEGFPLLLSSAAIIVYNKIDQVMIGNMIDNTHVGYYATAEKFLTLILFIPQILVQTVTPLLVQKHELDYQAYLTMRKQFIGIIVWVAIIISASVSICSYWLIYLTFGSTYILAVPVLSIIAWKAVGNALSETSGQLIILEKKQKWAVFRNLIGCILNISLNLVLIPLLGIIGSAWVSLITIFASGVLANGIIPSYRSIFKDQITAIFKGWNYILNIKSITNK